MFSMVCVARQKVKMGGAVLSSHFLSWSPCNASVRHHVACQRGTMFITRHVPLHTALAATMLLVSMERCFRATGYYLGNIVLPGQAGQ